MHEDCRRKHADLIQGLQLQRKTSVSVMQTHRTRKKVTHETGEEEIREEVRKWNELKIYIGMCNTFICISNWSSDT